MNVLSLFDGMSCGQIALNRLGIEYDNYYASEIKDHAIKVTKHNFPDTIHIGDVTKFEWSTLPKIDLLIGGSPCQDFSRGNKERLGLEGSKSSLFFKYIEALEILKPKYFLLENVVMDIEDNNYITKTLEVMPVRINSSLVSAQLRDRYYWTNIQGTEQNLFDNIIEQPKNKNIKLQDILTEGYSYRDKARCIQVSDSRPEVKFESMWKRYKHTGFRTVIYDSKDYDPMKGIRYMNQIELERCQTVPEGYTGILSRNDAAGLLGDGWTVDVICHILQGLKTTFKSTNPGG